MSGQSDPKLSQPFILACRSVANFVSRGQSRPDGDVTRACKICREPVSLTQRGQEQESAGGGNAIILCNTCALVMLAELKAGGSQAEFRMNPEATKAVQDSQEARNMHDLFRDLFKPGGSDA